MVAIVGLVQPIIFLESAIVDSPALTVYNSLIAGLTKELSQSNRSSRKRSFEEIDESYVPEISTRQVKRKKLNTTCVEKLDLTFHEAKYNSLFDGYIEETIARGEELDASYVPEIKIGEQPKREKFELSFLIDLKAIEETRLGGQVAKAYSPTFKQDVIVKKQPLSIYSTKERAMQEITNCKFLLENVTKNGVGEIYYADNICKLLFHGFQGSDVYMVLEKGEYHQTNVEGKFLKKQSFC